MTADDLMRLVNRYTEACDDLGAGLFNQTEAETNAKHAKAKELHGQILAEVYRLHAVAEKSERHVTIEDAHAMGASGAEGAGIEHSEPERLAFEAWMRGHCWSYSDTWNGAAYVNREGYDRHGYDPVAQETRRLWAAWRDRAALTFHTAPLQSHDPVSTR